MKTQHEVELRARIDDLVAELSTNDQVELCEIRRKSYRLYL